MIASESFKRGKILGMDYVGAARFIGEVSGWMFMVVIWWYGLWSRMRLDFPEKEIFSLALRQTLAAILGGIIGVRVGLGALALIWPVAAVTWQFCRMKKWDVWEWWDVMGVMSLALGLGAGVLRGEWWRLGGAVLGLVLAGFIGKNYRRFRWYKSGKVGLVGLFSLAWWGMVEVMVAYTYQGGIYLLGRVPVVMAAAITVLVALGAIYHRSRAMN